MLQQTLPQPLNSECVVPGHPLTGCLRKLQRAKEHMQLLGAVVEAWRKTNPVRLVRDFDLDAGVLSYRVRVQSPSDAIPLILGDALHNFHSTLDHLAWQLALLGPHGGKPPTGSTFPIFKNRSKFWRR